MTQVEFSNRQGVAACGDIKVLELVVAQIYRLQVGERVQGAHVLHVVVRQIQPLQVDQTLDAVQLPNACGLRVRARERADKASLRPVVLPGGVNDAIRKHRVSKDEFFDWRVDSGLIRQEVTTQRHAEGEKGQ